MAASEQGSARRRRKPSQLAVQLTDAFAALDEWSEVKVVRNEFGHRDRIVSQLRPPNAGPQPYNWQEAA
jgi:hypothetical protein